MLVLAAEPELLAGAPELAPVLAVDPVSDVVAPPLGAVEPMSPVVEVPVVVGPGSVVLVGPGIGESGSVFMESGSLVLLLPEPSGISANSTRACSVTLSDTNDSEEVDA